MLPRDMLSKLGLGLMSSMSSSSSSSEEEENWDEEDECDADGVGEDARMLVYLWRSEDELLGESAPSLPLVAPSSYRLSGSDSAELLRVGLAGTAAEDGLMPLPPKM